jgi:hypothetical protein
MKSELCSTRQMVENLKDAIFLKKGGLTRDNDIATMLGITETNLATKISRDSPPLKEILLFCDKHWIDPMRIVMKSS